MTEIDPEDIALAIDARFDAKADATQDPVYNTVTCAQLTAGVDPYLPPAGFIELPTVQSTGRTQTQSLIVTSNSAVYLLSSNAGTRVFGNLTVDGSISNSGLATALSGKVATTDFTNYQGNVTTALASKLTSSDLAPYVTSSSLTSQLATKADTSSLSSYVTSSSLTSTLSSYATASSVNGKADITALAAYAPLASPTFSGTVSGVTKAHVGLASVDNTSDASKPISTATQTALDLKANASALASYLTTATASSTYATLAGLASYLTTSTAAATYATLAGLSSYLTTSAAASTYAPIANPTFTGTVITPALTVAGTAVTAPWVVARIRINTPGTSAIIQAQYGSQTASVAFNSQGIWDVTWTAAHPNGANFCAQINASAGLTVGTPSYVCSWGSATSTRCRVIININGGSRVDTATMATGVLDFCILIVQSSIRGRSNLSQNMYLMVLAAWLIVRNEYGSSVASRYSLKSSSFPKTALFSSRIACSSAIDRHRNTQRIAALTLMILAIARYFWVETIVLILACRPLVNSSCTRRSCLLNAGLSAKSSMSMQMLHSFLTSSLFFPASIIFFCISITSASSSG